MIRKSFLRKGVSIFVRDNAKLYRQGSHLALGGTSGLGNTFFYRYLIWSSFHPDGIEVDTITETVFCGRIQKNGKDIFITRARFIQSRLSEPSLGRQSHKICAIIKMLGWFAMARPQQATFNAQLHRRQIIRWTILQRRPLKQCFGYRRTKLKLSFRRELVSISGHFKIFYLNPTSMREWLNKGTPAEFLDSRHRRATLHMSLLSPLRPLHEPNVLGTGERNIPPKCMNIRSLFNDSTTSISRFRSTDIVSTIARILLCRCDRSSPGRDVSNYLRRRPMPEREFISVHLVGSSRATWQPGKRWNWSSWLVWKL